MGFVSSIFNNLVLNVGHSGAMLGTSAALNATRYRKLDGKLQFISNRGYDNVYVYAAKRVLTQATFATISDLYPSILRNKYRKHMEKTYDAHQGEHMKEVLSNKSKFSDSFKEKLKLTWQYRGASMDEGVLLWIKNTSGKATDIQIQTYWDKIKNISQHQIGKVGKKAKYAEFPDTVLKVPGDIAFMDMLAIPRMQTRKNIILTKVQGRDYSRKELISNGDYEFSVSGKIVGNHPDEYPHAEVSKFVQLMQYQGVIQVYGLLFEQLNVTQVLVKDFQLNQTSGFKNVQPYSFSCVAIEPDEEAAIIEDTLYDLNWKLRAHKKGYWGKILETVKKAAANEASTLIQTLTANNI